MPEKVFDLLDQTNVQFDQFTLGVLFNACAHVANDRAKQIGKEFLNKMPDHFQNHTVLLTSAITNLCQESLGTKCSLIFSSLKSNWRQSRVVNETQNFALFSNMSSEMLYLFLLESSEEIFEKP